MGIIDKWVESLDYQFSVSDSCIRSKSPWATCNQCIQSCKEEAITLKDNLPIINAEKCVECGSCLAICPVQAVEGIFPKRSIVQNQLLAEEGNIPSMKELLVFYAKGITSILSVSEKLSGDWEGQMTAANTILLKMEKSPFSVQEGKLVAEKNDACSRRELFSLWGKESKSLVKQVTPAKWRFNHSNLELSRYYPDYQFFDVVVDTKKCSLCRVCEALCPKQVFSMMDDAFMIASQACSDCQLCSDACPEKAITINDRVTKAMPTTHETFLNTCEDCDGSFRTLARQDKKCPVCAKRKVGYLTSKV